jgi:molecular chaperone GrpE
MSPQNQNTDKDEDLTPEEINAEMAADHQDPAAEIDAAAEPELPEENTGVADDKITALENEVADLKDRLLRTLAETDNIRKRSEKERADTAKYAVSGFARQLLPVADNLRRALEAIPEEDRGQNETLNSIFVGVEATERELHRAFESTGIKVIDAMDQPFNPNFHEVMFEADMPDKAPGTVIQVLEPGYMIQDRLLRPARVGVAKGKKAKPAQVDENI